MVEDLYNLRNQYVGRDAIAELRSAHAPGISPNVGENLRRVSRTEFVLVATPYV